MLSRFAIAAIISSRLVAAAQLVDDNCPISAAVCALGEPRTASVDRLCLATPQSTLGTGGTRSALPPDRDTRLTPLPRRVALPANCDRAGRAAAALRLLRIVGQLASTG